MNDNQTRGMAEVLAAHLEFTLDDESRLFRCECGLWMTDEDRSDHLSDALSAAGFGDVREAKAQALDEAADAWGYAAAAFWLRARARAAAVRGER